MKDKLVIFDENKNPSQKYYEKLNSKEKQAVDNFAKYVLVNASEGRSKKAKTQAIRFLATIEKDFDKINLQDLRAYLLKLKEAKLSDYTTNDIKDYTRRFLKENFRDWSERFNEFEDIKSDSEPQRQEKLEVLSKQEVESLIDKETDIYWKAFLIVQYEGALRTGETIKLKWDMIDTREEEVYWLTITSKKNNRGKDKERIVPLSQAVYFIQELKKAQKQDKIISPYLFPSKQNSSAPISSNAVSMWFSRLTKRVLGKSCTNYLLRHSRGEEYHILVRDNKMSKENATRLMGHTEKMFDKTYSHPDKKLLKETLKKQLLNIGYIAPEKKNELELRVAQLEKDIGLLTKYIYKMNPSIEDKFRKK